MLDITPALNALIYDHDHDHDHIHDKQFAIAVASGMSKMHVLFLIEIAIDYHQMVEHPDPFFSVWLESFPSSAQLDLFALGWNPQLCI